LPETLQQLFAGDCLDRIGTCRSRIGVTFQPDGQVEAIGMPHQGVMDSPGGNHASIGAGRHHGVAEKRR